MTIKSKRIFLRKFPLLIIAVGNPIVLYNLKICSPSKESSRNSVGGALYREHGPSEDGNPALFFFPFYTTLQSSLNYIVAHSSFHFVTLPKVFFLASLPFQNTLLSWGHVRTPLVNTIFKFSFHAWQVPRSSVGRALYRECGPSQDRNPVPGDLPFCFVFFFFFFVISFSIYFFEASLLFIFYTSLKRSVEYLCIVLFSLYYIGQGFLPLVGKFTLSKCTLKLRTCIGTLLNLSVIISNN